ncbi:MAG: RNA methyltransferase [Coriobacteriia bacterium]|nr:RNA methyltransferase [Coriobacteriia bacterium]
MRQSISAPRFITSRDNDFFKQIKSYQLAKYRKQDNCFLAEGEKVYYEACRKLKLRYTIVSESYFLAHPYVAGDDAAKASVFADNIFESVSDLKTNQGILGIFELPVFNLEISRLSRVALLEKVQDPKNVGAIIRNAHCLGYEAVFLDEDCAAPFSPKVIRSSTGSVFHVPVLSGDILQHIQELKSAGFALVGTTLAGKEEVQTADKVALLVGNEGGGLSNQALALCDYLFRIKMNPEAESLNAAVASGIAMYLFNNA